MMQAIQSGPRALRRTLFAGASGLAVALSLGAGVALAQTPPQDPQADEVDEVVVTGFRGSLASALNIKRSETDMVDAISAEDIADFPDLNLAESIQRIPGVSIDRDAGEGRSLTVRGLSADFTRTRINGMEAQATTGGTDSSGGANRGRGFDFNIFASELFNNIRVRKTQAASIEEGSLGATIDLQTTRPFDYDGFRAAASAQYGYNDLSDTWDPRFAALISDTFMDGKFGLLASFAYSERNLFEEGFSSVRWDRATQQNGGFCSPVGVAPQTPSNNGTTGANAANCATGLPRLPNTPGNVSAYQTANQATVFIPRLPRYGRLVHQQERTGFTGSAQFRPTDRTTISYDLLYSNLESTREENFLEALSFSRNRDNGGQPQITVLEAEVENGALVYGRFNNVDIRSEQRFDQLKTEYVQHGLTLDHEFSDRFRMRGYLGRAVSDFANDEQTTVTLDVQNAQGFSWDFRDNPDTPLINWGFDVTNPAAWQWRDVSLGTTVGSMSAPRSEIRIRPQGVENTFESAQLDFSYDLNERFTLLFGGNWKTYESDAYEFRRGLGSDGELLVPALPPGVTVADISTLLTGYGDGLVPPGSATSWIIPDLDAIADLFNIYCNCDTGVPGGDFRLYTIENGSSRGGNRFVKEEDAAYYIQADFDVDLMGFRTRGNVGVRHVNTKLYAEGYSSTGGGTLVYGTHEYDDTLPSMNLAIDLTEDLVFRFGAAKVMARPSINSSLSGANFLVPTTSLAFAASGHTASIGNVELEPYRAKTIDLSLEWYFAPESLLSFAWFTKDIDTYLQLRRQFYDYAELTALNPIAFAPELCTNNPLCSGPTDQVQLTQAVNTPGGDLTGFEISYQQPFTFLPGFWSDFGVILNYTKVESEIAYCLSVDCDPANPAGFIVNDMVGLSPTAYNGTLYYEGDRFSARVSAAYRDAYLQQVPGRNNNALEGKQDTLTVDASASYELSDNIILTFEALNLTDSENHQWVGDDDRQSTSVYHHTGRQYYVGARYRF